MYSANRSISDSVCQPMNCKYNSNVSLLLSWSTRLLSFCLASVGVHSVSAGDPYPFLSVAGRIPSQFWIQILHYLFSQQSSVRDTNVFGFCTAFEVTSKTARNSHQTGLLSACVCNFLVHCTQREHVYASVPNTLTNRRTLLDSQFGG